MFARSVLSYRRERKETGRQISFIVGSQKPPLSTVNNSVASGLNIARTMWDKLVKDLYISGLQPEA
jgi:hypothetical protein